MEKTYNLLETEIDSICDIITFKLMTACVFNQPHYKSDVKEAVKTYLKSNKLSVQDKAPLN